MSVWLCIPSAAPADVANDALAAWTRRGYFTALFRDYDTQPTDADINFFGKYEGYAKAVNTLCRYVAAHHPAAEWFVAGGDDIHPDPNHRADDIAAECGDYFDGLFGVMEPTGDRWLEDTEGMCSAERVCIAPWMGRDWVDWAYGGKGPYPEGYYHFFADEELKLVAEKKGVLWQRRDLVQYHDNWQRQPGRKRPAYLERAVQAHDVDEARFMARRAAGFPMDCRGR